MTNKIFSFKINKKGDSLSPQEDLQQLASKLSLQTLVMRLPFFLQEDLKSLFPPFIRFDSEKNLLKANFKGLSIQLKLAQEDQKPPQSPSWFLDPGHVGPQIDAEGRKWLLPQKKDLILESNLNFEAACLLQKKIKCHNQEAYLSREKEESALGRSKDHSFLKIFNLFKQWPSLQGSCYQSYLQADLNKRRTFLDQGKALSLHFNAHGKTYQNEKGEWHVEEISPTNPIMAFINGAYDENLLIKKGLNFFLKQFLQPFWEESLEMAFYLVHNLIQKGKFTERIAADEEDPKFSYLKQNAIKVQKGVWARPLSVLQTSGRSLGPKVLMEADLLNSEPVIDQLQTHGSQKLVENVVESYFSIIKKMT